MPKIFQINKNQPDSQQMSPRAVIAILPFVYTEVSPIRVITQNAVKAPATGDDPNKVQLREDRPLIADPSEILSLTISDDKKTPTGTLSAILQPSQYNYLEACNPGDYIFAWICPNKTVSDDLIERIQELSACNDPKYGLKFFGKIFSCEEMFQMSNGVKTVRYALSAQSFDYYQTQVFNTPEALQGQNAPVSMLMYAQHFFSNVVSGATQTQNDNIFKNIRNIEFNAQDQVSYMHQAFMGAGGATVLSADPNDGLFKSFPTMFTVPQQVGKLFGKNIQNQKPYDNVTFSDIMNIIIGVQKFSDSDFSVSDTTDNNGTTFTGSETFAGPGSSGSTAIAGFMGPDFEETTTASTGKLFAPNDSNFNLKGKRLLNITPSMRGTIWQIISECSNPLVNEMYTCLRMSPKDNNILPTFICRQIPMSYNLPANDFSVTYFDDLPRFRIDKSNIMSYSLNKNNQSRMNMFFIQPLNASDQGSQKQQDAFNLSNVGYQIDGQDARKHGLHPFVAQVYENFTAADVATPDRIRKYSQFVRDINANLHLKLNGNLTTWGITDFICIGENLQIGDDLLFHIERITHNYAIQAGLPVFRTSFELSHGVRINRENLMTIGKTAQTSNDPSEVYTEFKPDFNTFLTVKGTQEQDILSDVRGNSFYSKSIPTTAQDTLVLLDTNPTNTQTAASRDNQETNSPQAVPDTDNIGNKA